MKKMMMRGARRRVLVLASSLSSLLAFGGVVAPSAHAGTVREGQWYLETMQAERMWEKTTGKGITVAVLDSGVRSSQPELQGKVLPGKSYISGGEGDDGREASDLHGTAMSALIAGDGQSDMQVKGLAPGVRILPVKMKMGLGDTSPIADGIRYAADSDAKIISMSIGSDAASVDDKHKAQLQRAVDYAVKRGKLLFAAVGNEGSRTNIASYPAATRGVVGVSAVDTRLRTGKFSTHGPQVALSAPGVDIPTVCEGKTGYCRGRGTSHATALASASAALVWSLHPKWTGNQVLRVLLDTAGRPPHGKVPSEYVGYGMIRPRENVLENKGDPGPPDVNPLVAAAEKADKSSGKSASPTAPATHEPAGATGKKSKGKGKDDNLPWFIGGAIAVAVPGAVLVALMVRRGRRKARARKQQMQSAVAAGPYGGTAPMDPPYPQQQPQQPPQPPMPPPGGGRPPGGS
ncbi:serine protease [Streptomyces mobaraensis NBRC 13819 = DSM 40847]|uniref:Serine protease n=2 Tax=Streptomyces mobaraensis TaxID=35621 RepID=M3AZE8_STRM1|nr:serine protease [Streptomyces mobaraensis NBRC 13819 = DSM 40847]